MPVAASLLGSGNFLPSASSQVELPQLWRFSSDDVFGQSLDGFVSQLMELQTIFEAAVTFQSLEKLEIGGSFGKMLTERLRQVRLTELNC